MEIIILIIIGIFALAFIAMWIDFAIKRPITVVAMLLLALYVSPDEDYVGTAITFLILSWLFTTKAGLIHVGGFLLGFIWSNRQK